MEKITQIIHYTIFCLLFISINCYAGDTYQNKVGVTGAQNYTNTAIWLKNGVACVCSPPTTLGNGDQITVNAGVILTLTGSLTSGNSNTITVKGTGEFHITGDFTVSSNNIDIIVEPGATFEIGGNFSAKNNAVFSIQNSGNFNVTGNFTTEQNAKPTIAGSVAIGGNTTFGNNTELNLTGSLLMQGTLDVTGFKNLLGTGTIGIGGVTCGKINCVSDCATTINNINTANTGGGSTATDLICGNWNSVLPVQFTNFYFDLQKDHIELLWSTAQEINNSHFIIQESFDGKNFTDKGIVIGAGNSNITQNYSFSLPFHHQTTYYRLKQVDIDGQFDYSKTIVQPYQLGEFLLYPNPSIEHVRCHLTPFNGNTMVSVSDELGNIVYNKIFETSISTEIDFSLPSKGFYFVKVIQGNNMNVQKLMIH